jgi:hypothetical protein
MVLIVEEEQENQYLEITARYPIFWVRHPVLTENNKENKKTLRENHYILQMNR